MTRRAHTEPMTKISMNINTRDIDHLRAFYPDVGYTVVLRALARQHVQSILAKTAQVVNVNILDDLQIEI